MDRQMYNGYHGYNIHAWIHIYRIGGPFKIWVDVSSPVIIQNVGLQQAM